MLEKNKKGYTLIEMMVVMGIMAVIMILGAFGMISANNGNIADEAAQDLLSTIREAQTKAVSVAPSSEDENPKIWAVEISPTYYRLTGYLDSIGSDILDSRYNGKENNFRSGISIKTTLNGSLLSDSGSNYVAYSTPFARPYITLGNSFVPGSETCKWQVSNRPEKDWQISCSPNVFSTADDKKLVVEINFKNNIRYVIVKSNGDAYISSGSN